MEKRQNDIDVIMADRAAKQILLGECKWRNEAPDLATVEQFLGKGYLMPYYQQFYYCFFSKVPFGKAARQLQGDGAVMLFDMESLFTEGL